MKHINCGCTCKGFECPKCKVFQCLGNFNPGDREQCRKCIWTDKRERLKEITARASAAETRYKEILKIQNQALLIKPDGAEQDIRPANGRRFTQGQIRHLLGAAPIYRMQMIDSYMYVGEEMLFKYEDTFILLGEYTYMRDGYIFTFDAPLNERATRLWGCPHDRIHGNVVIIPIEQSFD